MKFIMATWFPGHWDKIPGNRTQYFLSMIPKGVDKNEIINYGEIETLFIKHKDKGDLTVEGCWTGKTSNFEISKNTQGKDIVLFTVKIDKSESCPTKYQNYHDTWYCEDWQPSQASTEDKSFDPPFFSNLISTSHWKDFEQLTYYLLKVMGLHSVYKFPTNEQSGKSDGFFIFNNLAVIFDMTLDSNFEKVKEIQIKNYCNQLKETDIKYHEHFFPLAGRTKQVWIITRGTKSRIIRKEDKTTIKEVVINDLTKFYRDRIADNKMDEERFEENLKNI
ncbi:MAG: hypothetical protein V1871_05570 [Planctomycetota bacterium]